MGLTVSIPWSLIWGSSAGLQMVKDGEMLPETLGTVGRPLLSKETFVQLSNRFAEESYKMDGVRAKS